MGQERNSGSALQLEVTMCSQLSRECHSAAQALIALSSEQTCLLLATLRSGQDCLVACGTALSAATQEAAFHSISDILNSVRAFLDLVNSNF